jgi:MYXO-CTERM domain-containing protein
MLTTVFTGTSSGVSGGALAQGVVSMTNNLIVFDGVTPFGDVIDAAISQSTNLILDASQQDPGFVNLAGQTAADFDLTAPSPAIDQGTVLPARTEDFANRSVPDSSGKTDVGAFEYDSTEGSGGLSGTGGAAATGGADAAGGDGATGGTAEAAGGATGEAGDAVQTGGSVNVEAPPTETESGGLTCSDTQTLCGQVCVDLNQHTGHCGACDRPCAAGQVCTAGVCTEPVANNEAAPVVAVAEDGGCGCSTPGDATSGPAFLAIAASLAGIGIGRRRRRAAAKKDTKDQNKSPDKK